MQTVEPRALHILTECTTTELHTQPLFPVVWRQDSSLGWPRTIPASLVQSTLPSYSWSCRGLFLTPTAPISTGLMIDSMPQRGYLIPISRKDQHSQGWGSVLNKECWTRAGASKGWSLSQKVETHLLQRPQEAKSPEKVPTYISYLP